MQNNSNVELILIKMMEVDLQKHRDAVESKQMIGSISIIGSERVLCEDVDKRLNVRRR